MAADHSAGLRMPASPYRRQLRLGFPRLQFEAALEAEFRQQRLPTSVRRGRQALLVATALLFTLLGVDLLFGVRPGGEVMNTLRAAVLLPLLLVLLAALSRPGFWRYYDPAASVLGVVFGVAVSYGAISASLGGAGHLFSGLVLVVVAVYLLMGLLFLTALLTTACIVGGYLLMGLLLGLPPAELSYQVAVLVAAGTVGAVGAYNIEHAARAAYLESRVLQEQAERDALTGLYNRRIFDDYMRRVWRQASREHARLCVVLLDLDYFKAYNDLHGHQAGDECLRRVAGILGRAAQRPFDLCARYGGEEFVVVLYDPPDEFAETVPELLRSGVAALQIAHRGSPVAGTVTASVGAAMVCPADGRSLAGAVQMADEALYQAKDEGRNRVVFRDDADSPVITGSFHVERTQAFVIERNAG